MTFEESLLAAEKEHCLRLIKAGAGWHSYVLDKARKLDRRKAYRGLAIAVEQAIIAEGCALPRPWVEPAGTEVFAIPARYFPMAETGKKGVRK